MTFMSMQTLISIRRLEFSSFVISSSETTFLGKRDDCGVVTTSCKFECGVVKLEMIIDFSVGDIAGFFVADLETEEFFSTFNNVLVLVICLYLPSMGITCN